MTYEYEREQDSGQISHTILNSIKIAFVHKSIEKTQKFKYFWV